jgi:hypothetical protein
MFPKKVAQRLSCLDCKLYKQSDKKFSITETIKDGEAELHVNLRNAAIHFENVDERRWPYLTHKNCADAIVFQYADGRWILHIFELKRTIRSDSWKAMQKQFDGAFLNALVMAGFLKIDIDDITVYSCFREDKLTKPKESIEVRNATGNRNCRNIIESWKRSDYRLNCCETILCRHIKTQLDERGIGTIEL